MGEGSSRNLPCWCGSGIKYKKCHWNRENEEKVEKRKTEKTLKKCFSKKECMVPKSMQNNCSSEIISAHTVSKSSNLKAIAQNGHVYSHKLSMNKLDKKNGIINFEKIGINKASTFYGFCKFHDNEIFKIIEAEDFVGTLEQFFLLSYRALAKELYNKRASYKAMDEALSFDTGKTKIQQLMFQDTIQTFNIGTEIAINDLDNIMQKYNNTLIKKKYSEDDYIYYCMYLDKVPPVMCSGAIFPHYDFQGNLIQDLNDLHLKCDEVVLNAINIDGNLGAFIFFGRRTKAAKIFIDSFNKVNLEKKLATFINFLFTSYENIFIAPEWRDTLNQESKKILENNINKNIGEETKPEYLLPIDIEGIGLEIINIKTNL